MSDIPEVLEAKAKVKLALKESDLYGQLAEECSELAQAALKKQRILNGSNLPSASEDIVDANLVEELTDILLSADVIGLRKSDKIYDEKALRWGRRVTAVSEGKRS